MIAAIEKTLNDMGFNVPSAAYRIINICDDWYRARVTDAHKRVTVNGSHYTMERMGFGCRAAADDANLCEAIEINAGGGNDAQFEFVDAQLRDNGFASQFRRQLELTAAEGTAAAYVWLEGAQEYTDGSMRGGRLRINYVDALGFAPLTIENGKVTEAAFAGKNIVSGREEHTLVVCRRIDGKYHYSVRMYDDEGKIMPDRSRDVALGDVQPFAVMRTAQVNSLDGMEGFGLPKLYNVIPVLKGLDAAFTAFTGDLEQAEKITLINELLCGFDDNGKPIPPNESMKRRFVLLGEKLPQDKELVHEINPEIRVEAFRDCIELLLNLLSQQFGYGSKRYSFDKNTNEIATATQYIGERQDMLQELNRQRQEARDYICGIVRALLWFSNAYQGAAWNLEAEVLVEFDDSLIIDRRTQLEDMRSDVLAGIGGVQLRALYLKSKYNLEDAEAMKWAQLEDPDADSELED